MVAHGNRIGWKGGKARDCERHFVCEEAGHRGLTVESHGRTLVTLSPQYLRCGMKRNVCREAGPERGEQRGLCSHPQRRQEALDWFLARINEIDH